MKINDPNFFFRIDSNRRIIYKKIYDYIFAYRCLYVYIVILNRREKMNDNSQMTVTTADWHDKQKHMIERVYNIYLHIA